MQQLQLKARRVANKESTIQAEGQRALREQNRIQKALAEHNLTLSRKDEMLETLQAMQLAAQAKNKGVYEELLTSLIQEVIPGKDDQIVLTSSMKNNRATLDIDVMSNGNLESVYDDKGGSISNIVAMGLRFIVLARHPNRRVLMLDEADCHLRTEYIPAFAAVMNQLAIKLGIQVIYISHHPVNHFIGYGRVIELFKEGSMTRSRIFSDEVEFPDEYEAPQSAFRYLRLKNYGPHQNLLVDLSPAVNVITGDVDLGKSKLIQAVVDLCDNKGHEGRIYHEKGQKKPAFEVEIGLEEGMSLKWSYNRTAKKRTTMALYDADGEVIEQSDEGNGVPDWLHSYLAMAPVNGENIHFHSQKKSSYLLSDEFSSIERAQMLPLGRESRDVMRMIQLFNTQLSDVRVEKKRLEKELNVHQNVLAALSLIMDNPIDPVLIQEKCDEIIDRCRKTAAMDKLINSIDHYFMVSSVHQIVLKNLQREVTPQPVLLATEQMERCLYNLEVSEARCEALAPMKQVRKAIEPPVLHDLNGITNAGIRIKKAYDLLQALKNVQPVEIKQPVLKDHQQLEKLIASMESVEKNLVKINQDISDNASLRKAIMKEWDELIEQSGGLCPTCEQPFKGGHNHE